MEKQQRRSMGIVKNPCEIIFQFSEENNLNKKQSWIEIKKYRNNLPWGSGKAVIVKLNFFFFQTVLLFMDLFMYCDYFTSKRIRDQCVENPESFIYELKLVGRQLYSRPV